MKKLFSYLLASVFLASSIISCTFTKPTTKGTSTLFATIAEMPTQSSTAIATIPVKKSQHTLIDATQWKNKLQKIRGENYWYDERDMSPDGQWFVDFMLDKTIRLFSVKDPSLIIEYQINSAEIVLTSLYSWNPDSSTFLVCVSYTPPPPPLDCQSLKVFEILPDNTLKEHDINWAGYGFSVLWLGKSITLISPNTGIFQYTYYGSMINHLRMIDLVNPKWEGGVYPDTIIAIERPFLLSTSKYLPSTIYEFDSRSLLAKAIYNDEFPLSLLGKDSESKYLLLEQLSIGGQQSIGIELFDLKSHTIIQRLVLPPNTKIGRQSNGSEQVAFVVSSRDSEKAETWIYDFQTKSIETINGSGLMGWLYPNHGFLLNNQDNYWEMFVP